MTFNLLAQFALINACFVRSPIPLGSTVLLESRLDKKEGRKIFISCKVTSTDGSKVHTETTGNIHFYTPNVSDDDIMLVSKLAVGHISALLLSVSSLSCSLSCRAALFLSISISQLLKGVWHKCTSLPPARTVRTQRVLVYECVCVYLRENFSKYDIVGLLLYHNIDASLLTSINKVFMKLWLPLLSITDTSSVHIKTLFMDLNVIY